MVLLKEADGDGEENCWETSNLSCHCLSLFSFLLGSCSHLFSNFISSPLLSFCLIYFGLLFSHLICFLTSPRLISSLILSLLIFISPCFVSSCPFSLLFLFSFCLVSSSLLYFLFIFSSPLLFCPFISSILVSSFLNCPHFILSHFVPSHLRFISSPLFS